MKKEEEERLKAIVRENYEVIADHYSETRKKVLWSSLFEVAEKIFDGASVLDVGCGSGKLLQALKKKKVDYLGIDLSSELLKNARLDYSDYNFQEGDIMDLSKYKENYDYVFCVAVLQHIPARKNRIKALCELKKRICDNGRVVLTVWDMQNNKRYKKLIFKNNILRILGLNRMEMGDLVFDWKNSLGVAVSKRYYHAYKIKELERDCLNAELKIKRIYRADNNVFAELYK